YAYSTVLYSRCEAAHFTLTTITSNAGKGRSPPPKFPVPRAPPPAGEPPV
ncbi:hypothetical protein O988_05802, partial [Pseudogymnoascus sp. VKM F-3808]